MSLARKMGQSSWFRRSHQGLLPFLAIKSLHLDIKHLVLDSYKGELDDSGETFINYREWLDATFAVLGPGAVESGGAGEDIDQEWQKKMLSAQKGYDEEQVKMMEIFSGTNKEMMLSTKNRT